MSYKLNDFVTIKGRPGRIIREGLPNNFTVLLEDGNQYWVSDSANPMAAIYGPHSRDVYGRTSELVKVTGIPVATGGASSAFNDALAARALPAGDAAARATALAALAAADAAEAARLRSTGTIAGPMPPRLSSPISFSLSKRPCGRRSYGIDTTSASAAAAAAAKSTTIPPPVFKSPDSTLSFLRPRAECRKSR